MRTPAQITQDSYNSTAQLYANNVADLAPLENIHKMMKLLPKNPKILELGSGSGRDAKILSELGANVLGIDFSAELIQIAEKHAPLAEFQEMDILDMRLPGDYFDGVWAVCSLMHLPKKEIPKVLQNIYTLLKPQGYLHIALKKGASEGLELDTRYKGNHEKFCAYYEEAELKSLLQRSNFKIVGFELHSKKHRYHSHDAYAIFAQKA